MPKVEYEYLQVEYSDDESYQSEVTADSESDEDAPLPQASKPLPPALDIRQGSLSGKEFDGLKKDSRPLLED